MCVRECVPVCTCTCVVLRGRAVEVVVFLQERVQCVCDVLYQRVQCV